MIKSAPGRPAATHTFHAAADEDAAFRNLIEQSLVGVYIHQWGRFVYVNRKLAEIFGCTGEDLLGLESPLELIEEEDRPGVLAAVRESMGRSGMGSYSARARTKDGRRVHLRVHCTRSDYRGGPALVGTVLDVTEQEQAQEALRTRAAQQATLTELGQRALAGSDLDLLMEEAASVAARSLSADYGAIWMLDPEAGSLVLRAASGWQGDDPPAAGIPAGSMFAAARALESGEPVCVEELERTSFSVSPSAPGAVASVSVPLRGKQGLPFGVLEVQFRQRRELTKEDVNYLQALANVLSSAVERKKAEERLRRSEEHYRAAIEHVFDIITILSVDGRIHFQSPSVTRVLGYEQHELVGADIFELIHPEDAPYVLETFVYALQKEGHSPSIEFRMRHKDGTWRFLEATGSVLDEAAKTGVVTCRDVTDRKRAEEALQESEHRFRQAQKMEAIGRLAGGVAHDFNNLLTIILGISDMLPQQSLEPRVRSDLAQIRAAAEKAATLTRQLLAFSRRQVLQPRVLNLNELIQNTEKLLRRLIGEDIELVTALAPDLGHVKVDPGQIDQVLVNLVVNSRDAMPNGGRILIETANVEFDEDYASRHVSVQPGSYVMLAVTDNGVGLDEETRTHLFEPFFTTKDSGTGTGLGLSTVYGIVKQSGGNIWAYSEPGMGATFKIYLPRLAEDAFAAETAELGTPIPRGKETILVAEDDFSVRELARRILEMSGYRVLLAGHGEEAIQIARRFAGRIDLLLTDVVMPEMSGRELAGQLLKLRPETKILYCSGYTRDALGHHGVLDPETPFLSKPFSRSSLAAKVRETLDAAPPAAD